jgi:hypothetical protein
LVEHTAENRGVASSILALATLSRSPLGFASLRDDRLSIAADAGTAGIGGACLVLDLSRRLGTKDGLTTMSV